MDYNNAYETNITVKGTETVYFLNYEYEIPISLRRYVQYIQKFDVIKDELLKLLIKEMKTQNFLGFLNNHYQVYFKEMLKSLVVDLSCEGVYDVTVDDFTKNNEGYSKCVQLQLDTVQRFYTSLLQTLQQMEYQSDMAYNNSMQQVTGMGFGILTSSTAMGLLYLAMESNTVSKQYSSAQKEYELEFERIKHNNITAQNANEQKIRLDYYKKMENNLSLCATCLMDIYLEALQRNNKFDYESVKLYNVQRSSEILSNSEYVKDKTMSYVEAFKCCPYNSKVYTTLIDKGLIDLNTYKTADYILQNKELSDYFKNYCRQQIKQKKYNLTQFYDILSYLGDLQSEIRKLYSDDVDTIESFYSKLNKIIDGKLSIKNLIEQLSPYITSSELMESKEDTYTTVKDKICGKKQIDIITVLMKAQVSLNHFDDVTTETLIDFLNALESKIYPIYEDYITKVEDNFVYYKSIADNIKRTIEDEKAIDSKQDEKYKEKKENLTKKLEATRFFDFSTKKGLKSEIAQLDVDRKEERNKHEETLRDLQKQYQSNMSLAEKLI